MRNLLCALVFVPFFLGCSVEYGQVYDTQDFVPELMLSEASFFRIEKGNTTTCVTSKQLEEFKDSGKVFAQDIQFETKNDLGETTATGRAGIMSADTKKEIYEFFDGINIESHEHNVKIMGESLKWNGKTEQLTGERYKEITIEKDGMVLNGRGFSASAISEQFSFGANVFGSYEDKE